MDDTQNLHHLSILKRQYFQLVEPSQLRWPENIMLKAPAVQSWLFHNLFDVERMSSLPLERYQLRVLKLLVSKLEESMDNEEDVGLPLSIR